MSRMLGASPARLWLALAVVASGAVVLLVPSLLTIQTNPPSAVVLAAIALAVSALLVHSHEAGPALGAVASRPRATDEVASCRTGEATDAPHHPLQPRAPGLV